jgi:hypothetical protein
MGNLKGTVKMVKINKTQGHKSFYSIRIMAVNKSKDELRHLLEKTGIMVFSIKEI